MAVNRSASAAVAGFVFFAATAVGAQILHPRAMAATPISSYLKGPGSMWLQSGYYVLAVSLVLLALAIRARQHSAWRFVPVVALVVTACAVVLVAYTYSSWPLPGNPAHPLRVRIHILSAFSAFLCATIAIFVATPLLARRRLRVALFALAAVTLALEAAAVSASDLAPDVYGAFEKLAIAGIVVWLIAAALRAAISRQTARERGVH